MSTAREHDRDGGFTLIELLIAVGIIGILIGVMIPTFLQARVPAQDRQAQTLLRSSLTAAKAIETADGVTPTQVALGAEETSVAFVAGGATAPASRRNVSVANPVVGSSWYLILVSHSSSGRCFALLEGPTQAPQFQRVDNAATCQADQFDTVTGWTGGW